MHFTRVYQSIEDATKLKLQAELLRTDPSLNEEDQEVMLEGRNIMVEYDRMSMGRRSGIPEHAWTFDAKLQYVVEEWSQDLEDVDHPYRRSAKDYVHYRDEELPKLTDRKEKKACLNRLGELEFEIGAWYLKNTVKVVFCTLSTSAHSSAAELRALSWDAITVV